MKALWPSFFRITFRVAFLTGALVAGFVFWHLSTFLNLDGLRPQITEFLETTFHCQVLLGHVRAEIVPSPGVVVGHVVLLTPGPAPKVLAAVSGVHLSVSTKSLWHGHFRFWAARFTNPRLFLHRHLNASGQTQWEVLTLPQADPSSKDEGVNRWDIRNGSFELWDHTTSPTTKWVLDHLDGNFQSRRQRGAVAGHASFLGPQSLVNIHYDALGSTIPIHVHVTAIELEKLLPLLHFNLVSLHGLATMDTSIQINPSILVETTLERDVHEGTVHGTVRQWAKKGWEWSALGKDFSLDTKALKLPEWRVHGNGQSFSADVHAVTPHNGHAHATWQESSVATAPRQLRVDISSMTIHDLLTSFSLATSSQSVEPWMISQGTLDATLNSEKSWKVTSCAMDVQSMHIDVTGDVITQAHNPLAHLVGDIHHMNAESVVGSFVKDSSPITGTGDAHFDLTFPLSSEWLAGLTGPVDVTMTHGVIRMFKTVYRIVSLLNLTNYLRLKLPQITAEGIEFESIAGHLTFQNGVISSDDLFLKSPNMNIGMTGSVDLPRQSMKTALRIEMFRFLEVLLKDVPITHWIFKKPNKIFLPLLVTVQGPWDDLQVL